MATISEPKQAQQPGTAKTRTRRASKRHDRLNVLISKVKIKPSDYFAYPIGLFDKQEVPRGFCVAVRPNSTAHEAVGVQTRVRPIKDKLEYSLIIANRSKKAFYAEISKL